MIIVPDYRGCASRWPPSGVTIAAAP